jgi:hypothetical protein
MLFIMNLFAGIIVGLLISNLIDQYYKKKIEKDH